MKFQIGDEVRIGVKGETSRGRDGVRNDTVGIITQVWDTGTIVIEWPNYYGDWYGEEKDLVLHRMLSNKVACRLLMQD